jgi:hypothetical protein
MTALVSLIQEVKSLKLDKNQCTYLSKIQFFEKFYVAGIHIPGDSYPGEGIHIPGRGFISRGGDSYPGDSSWGWKDSLWGILFWNSFFLEFQHS